MPLLGHDLELSMPRLFYSILILMFLLIPVVYSRRISDQLPPFLSAVGSPSRSAGSPLDLLDPPLDLLLMLPSFLVGILDSSCLSTDKEREKKARKLKGKQKTQEFSDVPR